MLPLTFTLLSRCLLTARIRCGVFPRCLPSRRPFILVDMFSHFAVRPLGHQSQRHCLYIHLGTSSQVSTPNLSCPEKRWLSAYPPSFAPSFLDPAHVPVALTFLCGSLSLFVLFCFFIPLGALRTVFPLQLTARLYMR
jgi:hypothetical protein